MSVLNLALMLAAVAVFVRRAPFSWPQKVLFAFGYYCAYEYTVIARSYSLTILFLFLLAAFHQERFTKPIRHSSLIALLANANVHSLAIAIALGAIYLIELCAQRGIAARRRLAASLVIAAGLLISIYQILPPADLAPHYARWYFPTGSARLRIAPKALAAAFLPIPYPQLNFWNTFMADYLRTQSPVPRLLPFLASFVFLAGQGMPLVIYAVSSIGLSSIFVLKGPSYARHYGLIFMLFIFSLWIAKRGEALGTGPGRARVSRILGAALSALLLLHVIGTMVASYFELRHDFSASKKMALYLKGMSFIRRSDTFIASYPSPAASSILPYIEKRYSRFYFIEYQGYHSFSTWNKTYWDSYSLSTDKVIERLEAAVANKGYRDVLLITNAKIEEEKLSARFDLIAYFDDTIVRDESFALYRLKR
jgi:hypothetical protein